MINILSWIIVAILVSCTPMTSAMKSSQSSNQAASQASAQSQGTSHQDASREMPIIIICNHMGTGSSECIRRNVPFDDIKGITQ